MPEESPHQPVLEAFDLSGITRDLVLITLWMAATLLFIYVPVLDQTFLLAVFALPLILFIPGYVLILAIFPGKTDLDGIERLALSIGLSISVVLITGLLLHYTPWGIRPDTIVISLVIFTLALMMIVEYRCSLLPPDQRFTVPFRKILARARRKLFEPGQSRRDAALSLILLIAIVAAISATVYVIVVPKQGESFTEFSILGPGGKAAGYPTRFPADEPQSLIIGIGNHEYRDVTYTVEIILVNMTFDETTNTSSINAWQPLDSFAATLAHNETGGFLYNFTVTDRQFNRLQFLLFNETVPSPEITGQDRINTSYRDLHLWITVLSSG